MFKVLVGAGLNNSVMFSLADDWNEERASQDVPNPPTF